MAIKRIAAKEAALLVNHNDNVGFSGFTHAGCPKIVSLEISKRAEKEHAEALYRYLESGAKDIHLSIYTMLSPFIKHL